MFNVKWIEPLYIWNIYKMSQKYLKNIQLFSRDIIAPKILFFWSPISFTQPVLFQFKKKKNNVNSL